MFLFFVGKSAAGILIEYYKCIVVRRHSVGIKIDTILLLDLVSTYLLLVI